MKSTGQLKTALVRLFVTLALLCFALNVQAVSPPPDGGYPGANTAEGQNALQNLSSGMHNTATGFNVLFFNTTGSFNTATGSQALKNTTAGANNTATGFDALFSNTGSENTAHGSQALLHNTIGVNNTASGAQALFHNTEGSNNTADGSGALFFNTTGSANTAIGQGALANNTTGNGGNIALGCQAGNNVITANNVIAIGTSGANVSNSCFIGNIFGVTSSGGTAIFVNSDGKLGTTTSSRRFKDDIQPMERASEALFALQPVTFRYKKEIDPQGAPQWGLVAEDVEKVNPTLVVRDAEGKVNTVRYDAVNAMLLNEFLKEHRTVQELKSTAARQEATIAQLKQDFQSKLAERQKEIQTLTASLKEQTALIQKVSAQLDVIKFATGRIRRGGPAPRMVLNTQ